MVLKLEWATIVGFAVGIRAGKMLECAVVGFFVETPGTREE